MVYGRPDTWDGFWYVALAEQFRGSLVGPFDGLPGKAADLITRTVDAFGPLAVFLPLAFVATALRRPRYALLTGSAVAITCFFAASYVNAMIDRYYLVPALIAWTWLAILAESVARHGGHRIGRSATAAARDRGRAGRCHPRPDGDRAPGPPRHGRPEPATWPRGGGWTALSR